MCIGSRLKSVVRSKSDFGLILPPSVPVSQPILTFHPAEARTVEGSVLTLHCEDPRGSLPILYQFYREKLLLPRSSTRSDTGASYRFSLTEAHSGNYYCTADNGFGSKRSNTVSLSVTGKPWGSSHLHCWLNTVGNMLPSSNFLFFFLGQLSILSTP